MSGTRFTVPAIVAAGVVGVLVGRWSAPAGVPASAPAPTRPPSPVAHAPGAGTAAPPATGAAAEDPAPGPTVAAATRTNSDERPAAPSARGSAETAAESECPRERDDLRAQLEADRRQRREADGAPIPQPAAVPAKFGQEALLQAGSLALKQSRVPGRIETIDCGEYPCILYGRIFGDEDLIERVERARAFATYADDVLTLLSWSATDEAARAAGHPRETRPERLLVAIAIYSREDRARYGDQIDRRVRVRTADLWNALRPDDEE